MNQQARRDACRTAPVGPARKRPQPGHTGSAAFVTVIARRTAPALASVRHTG